MTELTHEELTRLLDYDPETGVFRWRVDSQGGVKAGSVAGSREIKGNRISVNGNRYNGRRLAWFYTYGEMPQNNLFVKNGDRHDDRIANIGMVPDKPKELTHEYLKQCIDYNPETGDFKWKITEAGNIYGNNAFCVHIGRNNDISLRSVILGKPYMTNRLIVFWMTGYMPSPNRVVMPIDNNALNLKWGNIKVGNRSDACIKKRNNGMLASKGVYFHKQHNKYYSNITINGKQKFLGLFKTEAEAHEAYMKAARKHYGELANDGYEHAIYHMETVPVERDVSEELLESAQQAADISEGTVKPAVVHDVGF